MPAPRDRIALSPSQAASFLGVSTKHIRALLDAGALPGAPLRALAPAIYDRGA
jgi:hypothetical protein